MKSNSNLKKAFIWNTLGSGFTAFNSLFFLIIATRINGKTEAGIFTLCYATAGLLYIIGTYAGRTYQVTEQKEEIGDNEYIVNRILTVIIMLISSVLFSLASHYTNLKLKLLILLCLMRAVEALCDVFHGILQKNDRLDIVGKSLLIRSILNIIAFLTIDKIFNNLVLSCLSLIIIDILVLIFIDIKYGLKYKDKNKKISYSSALSILKLGFYTFGFTLLANYLINIPRYSIDKYLDESFQTIFGIIVMPGTFITLLSQFIMQPLITKMKSHWINKEKNEFNNIVKKTLLAIVGVGIISILLAYFFGIMVLNFLYGLDLSKYLISLIIILIGTTFYALSLFLSNCLIIFRKTKVQLTIYSITVILGIIISRLLVSKYAFTGGIYSYLLIMLLLFIMYIVTFIFTNNKTTNWKGREKDERKN